MSIRLMIRLCVATLKQGFMYAHELMPRIITIWLDTVPSKDESNTQPQIEGIATEPSTVSFIYWVFKKRLKFSWYWTPFRHCHVAFSTTLFHCWLLAWPSSVRKTKPSIMQ